MPNLRWWLLVAVLVAVAAFLTGLLRGATDTSPFEVEEAVAVRAVDR